MPQPISLYDSYLKKQITLNPDETVKPGTIKMYSCGPTVYNYQSIGNMRAAWLPDTIAKVAKLAGWEVEWTLNITDVGHLVSDGDEGEDKIEKGAKRDGKTVQQIVDYYTQNYLEQCRALNLEIPEGDYNPKATDYVKEQMILALKLLAEDKAYLTEDGIYYDTVENQNTKETNSEQRIVNNESDSDSSFTLHPSSLNYTGREIVQTEKKHPDDFALWKFVSEKNLQKWKFNQFDETEELMIQILQKLDSKDYDLPNRWGTPGWHSECVCMICGTLNGHFPPKIEDVSKTNSEQLTVNNKGNSNSSFTLHPSSLNSVIDIHTGGEDHIDIHHKNEILQSQALGFNLSKYWVHNKFVMVDGGKMSKSLGNIYLVTGKREDTGFYSLTNPLEEIRKKLEEKHGVSGFDPLAYRLMLMEHHYTEQLNFTWDKLEQSQVRLWNLRKEAAKLQSLYEVPFGADKQLDSKYEEMLQAKSNTTLNLTWWKSIEQKQTYRMDRQIFHRTKQDWIKILVDNLNLPKFLEEYQKILLETNQKSIEEYVFAADLYGVLGLMDVNLDLGVFAYDSEPWPHQASYKKAKDFAIQRFQAKQSKDFQTADRLRDEIAALGWQVDDYAWGWGVWFKTPRPINNG